MTKGATEGNPKAKAVTMLGEVKDAITSLRGGEAQWKLTEREHDGQ